MGEKKKKSKLNIDLTFAHSSRITFMKKGASYMPSNIVNTKAII